MAAEVQKRHPNLAVELIPSSGGVFEVAYEGATLHSKKETGRFPNLDEIAAKIH